MARETDKRIDPQIFKNNASTGNAINLGARIFRGGTRL